MFSIAVINTRQKATWGRKGLFLLTVHHQGKPGQDPGAETEAEIMEGAAYCLAFNHFLIPRDGTKHSDLSCIN